MPVILILWIVNFYINYFYEGIKSYVIFFSIIIYINIIYLLSLFYSNLQVKPNNNVLQFSRHSLLRSRAASIKNILLILPPMGYCSTSTSWGGRGEKSSKRNYSTLKGSGALCTKNIPKRKTLSSPESRPYTDLYEGRGTPKNEPIWVKDNGKERSPFGASWAKDGKDRILYPTNYTCNYINILDPYNNRKLIKETCKGNRVVYIWTYIPTGICLVGSSSNSVERVLSYFEKKYLFLDTRRGLQFLADYGFKNIQLTIIYFEYHKITARDIKILEAYFINELNSSLNSQKYVYLPTEPLESVLPFINITNRDTSVPIFVYGPDLKRVLYIFNSKTSFYSEFNIHWNTVDKYLDKLDNKLYNYFTFSTQILEGSDLDNLLSLNELLEIKSNVDPNIPRRGQRVKLTNLTNNLKYEFYSLSKAAKFIEETIGSCDTATLRSHMKNNSVYKKIWKIEKL